MSIVVFGEIPTHTARISAQIALVSRRIGGVFSVVRPILDDRPSRATSIAPRRQSAVRGVTFFYVFSQGTTSGAGKRTERAFVRFFSRVYSTMILEARRVGGPERARVACVRAFAVVGPQMGFEMSDLSRSIRTEIASVRFFFGVRSYVSLESPTGGRCMRAMWANVRFFSRMGANV